MKRCIISVFLSVLILAFVPIGTFADNKAKQNEVSPQIFLASVPEYGDTEGVFTGVVFDSNGSSLNPGDYSVMCFLKVSETDYWFEKPTAENFIIPVYPDGSFSFGTVTGGTDELAVLYHIFLVPSSICENLEKADYEKAAKAAVDMVEVVREPGENGKSTVSPQRAVLRMTEYYLPEIEKDKIMTDADFFTEGVPGETALTHENIDRYLEKVAKYANAVRIYDSFSDEYDYAYGKANELGLFTVGSAWLDSGNEAEHYQRLDRLIERANSGEVKMACISSEALLRGDITEDKMIEYLEYTRSKIMDRRIAVTFADSVNFVYESFRLAAYCDVLFVNNFPMWQEEPVNSSLESFSGAMESLQKKYPHKTVICSETGWSSQGSDVGKAEVSEANAAEYFREIRNYSIENNLRVFYFMFADCEYKGTAENHNCIESHFGIFTKDLKLKEEFKKLEPFVNNPDSEEKTDVPEKETEKSGEAIEKNPDASPVWLIIPVSASVITAAVIAVIIIKAKKRA